MGPDVWLLLRVLVSLVVVLTLAVVSLRFGLPWLQNLQARGGSERRIRVLEVTSLDRQNRLALVRVDHHEYLLAVGPQGAARIDGWSENEMASEEAVP